MGSVSATMPLEMVTGMVFSSIDKLTPARFKSAKKSSEAKEPVDSSSAVIDNMRFDGNIITRKTANNTLITIRKISFLRGIVVSRPDSAEYFSVSYPPA